MRCPRVGEMGRLLHMVRVHAVVTHTTEVATLVVNDHSHGGELWCSWFRHVKCDGEVALESFVVRC